MTSAINPSLISTTFPVAGQDNDSQGFRSNFAAIASNFTEAATELTALQTVAVTVADLATQTEPVVNNLLGSTLSNGQYQLFSGVLHSQSSVSTAANIDLTMGAVHKISLSGNAVLTFTNWPTYVNASIYTEVSVILTGASSTAYTPTFAATGGNIINASTWSAPSVSNTSHYKMKAWTIDGGQNVFLENPVQFAG